VCALLVALAPDAAASEATSSRNCSSFSFTRSGTPWRAQEIRTRRVSCRTARALIRSYATPRDCQFQPRCRVEGWACRTLEAEGSTFTERCTRRGRVVRWRGSYTSS
jgi:hypothetical protein